MKDAFNPSDISRYYGKTFVITNKSEYRITEKGTIEGRESIEGANLSLIAGIKPELYDNFVQLLGDRQAYESLIRKHAEEPSEGKLLILSLTKESAERTKRNGLVTRPLESIN